MIARLLLGATAVLLCVATLASAGADEELLKKLSTAWEAAFNAGKAKELAALYTPDAMLLPPNAESVTGTEPIEKTWAEVVASAKGTFETQEVAVEGDLAYIVGTYELTDHEGKVVDRGKYLEIWTRRDGRWGLHRDIWNTSLPIPSPGE